MRILHVIHNLDPRSGGAIHNVDDGTVSSNNVTITLNQAGGKKEGGGGGIANGPSGTVRIANTKAPNEQTLTKNIVVDDNILRALKTCGGKVSGGNGAARLLGIPATTLNSRMKALNIQREKA